MLYTHGQKKIRIPDDILAVYQTTLGLSQEEAIQVYLEDEGILENAEQEALEKKARDNRITATIHQARKDSANKSQSERVRKADPTKEEVITTIADALTAMGATEVTVVNKGKLITFKIGADTFKVDLIRQRPPKK